MGVSRVEKVPLSVAGFGNTLTHDLIARTPSALEIFQPRPAADIAAEIDRHTYPRAALADALKREALASDAPQSVLANIELLRDPRTLVVATGQQAGFLGGPLYSLHKALSAVAQAREYSEELKRPVVPIFWLAADDHDHGEIDHAYALDAAGELKRLHAPLDPAQLGCSACDLRLTGEAEPIAELTAGISALFGDETARNLIEIYRANTFSQAFAELFYRWLGDTGIILAPSNALRVLAPAPALLTRDLADYATVSRLIQDAGTRMKTAGYEPGFAPAVRTSPHFFIATDDRLFRAALDTQDGTTFTERSAAFESQGIMPLTYTRADIERLLRDAPKRFSASAALRPVLQQSLFPVLSAVLGPGEVSYWAQLREVHAHFGAVWPIVSVRSSVTLIDPAGTKSLRKLGLDQSSPDIFLREDALRARLLTGSEAGRRLKTHSDAILKEFDALRTATRALDGGVEPLLTKARERIAHEIDRVIEKTTASVSQREDAGTHRVHHLANLVRPRGQLQERIVSAGNFLLRYPNLAVDLLAHIPPSGTEHHVIALD